MLMKLKSVLQVMIGAVLAAQLGGCIFVDHDHYHHEHRVHEVVYVH